MVEFRIAEQATPNFHQAIIGHGDRAVAIVAARDVPVAALARPRSIDGAGGSPSGPLEFVDEPDLRAALLGQTTWRVLARADLDQPFDPGDWPHLDAADVGYWQPATVGEALFNYWD